MVTITSQVDSHSVVAIQVVVVAIQVVVVAMQVVVVDKVGAGDLIRHGVKAGISIAVETVVGILVVRCQWVGAIKSSPITTSPSLAIANTGGQHRWFWALRRVRSFVTDVASRVTSVAIVRTHATAKTLGEEEDGMVC